MKINDILIALLVAVIWGVNFVVIKVGVTGIPPLFLGALRFLFVALPAVFFIPRPKIALSRLVIYGLTICFGQFAFLFSAVKAGMPAGIASVVLQSQVFFTIVLGGLILKESLKISQVIGIIVAVVGLTVLAKGGDSGSLTDIPLMALMMTLAGGFSWACGNICNRIIMKETPDCNGMSLVAWSALVPIIPFILMSLWMEGADAIVSSISHISLLTVGAIMYLAYLSTFVGYTLWSRLLGRYETWRVTPFALLVPFAGIASSALLLGETITMMQFAGLGFIMTGLILTVFGKRLVSLLTRRKAV